LACGGAPSPAPQVAGGKASVPACERYAEQLCTKLGPRSESCRSVMGVVVLMPPSACDAGMADFSVTEQRITELRAACETIVRKVCDAVGEDSDSCLAIRHDLPQIPPGHCAALLRDQDQLIAALRAREAMDAPISQDDWALLIADSAPSFGAADAKVVVVEFSDFQCPFCAQAADTVQRVKDAYGQHIRFVFRQFPLPFHPQAQAAAQASLAAHEQGKFWDYHDLLFDNQNALEQEALLAYAQRLGLDMEAFAGASTGASTASRVAEDMRLGESVRIRGTPTLFVNRKRVENPIDFDEVSTAIDEALEAAD
jgi:protein-disulfide isomerase